MNISYFASFPFACRFVVVACDSFNFSPACFMSVSPVNMLFFLSHFHVIISTPLGEVKRDIIWKIKETK